LQAACFDYDEPTSGGANNYSGWAVFGAVTVRMP
jgi:hypothetical protein